MAQNCKQADVNRSMDGRNFTLDLHIASRGITTPYELIDNWRRLWSEQVRVNPMLFGEKVPVQIAVEIVIVCYPSILGKYHRIIRISLKLHLNRALVLHELCVERAGLINSDHDSFKVIQKPLSI